EAQRFCILPSKTQISLINGKTCAIVADRFMTFVIDRFIAPAEIILSIVRCFRKNVHKKVCFFPGICPQSFIADAICTGAKGMRCSKLVLAGKGFFAESLVGVLKTKTNNKSIIQIVTTRNQWHGYMIEIRRDKTGMRGILSHPYFYASCITEEICGTIQVVYAHLFTPCKL